MIVPVDYRLCELGLFVAEVNAILYQLHSVEHDVYEWLCKVFIYFANPHYERCFTLCSHL